MKKQRFALQPDRDVARILVDALRVRLLSGDPAHFDAEQNREIPGVPNLGVVCHLLDQFAKFGTFGEEFSDPAHFKAIRAVRIPGEYLTLRKTHNYEKAIAMLVEKYECSETTVRTIVKATTAK
jgi:hypothetical protein